MPSASGGTKPAGAGGDAPKLQRPTPPAMQTGNNAVRVPAGKSRKSGTGRSGSGLPSLPSGASSVVDSGAGVILGLLVWGWIVLPFLKGGTAGMKKTLLAKFFNKGPDGKYLP